MNLQLHPYSIPLVISALIAAGIAGTIWRRRFAQGAIWLLLHMLGVFTWSAASAAMWISTSQFSQIFWLSISFLGIFLVPPTFLLFSLQITQHEHLVTRRLVFYLALVPLLGLFLVLTNGVHHLVFSPTQLWVTGRLAELRWSAGIFVPFSAFYTFALAAVGIWFLVRSMSQGGDLMREQLKLVILGAGLSFCADAFILLPVFTTNARLVASPLFHTLAGAIYVYAIYRTKLLDVVPVVHSTLVNSMTDGVLVLDEQDRIVEMNPAAGRFLDLEPGQAAGRAAGEILSGWQENNPRFWAQDEVHTEITVPQDVPRIVDLVITPLLDERKHSRGRMLVFRDITAQKNQETSLSNTNKLLNEQLDEIRLLRDQLREQAVRDPLTNLYNRRYLEESLHQELARALRENYPVCVIMLDIDRFKRVNDTCGHKAGDEVLQSLASLVTQHVRRFDTACRYGGEEFVIVMPKLSIETARERAEFLRREFASMPLPCGGLKTGPTISLGLAAYPADGFEAEQLLDAADRALYHAKGSGRNRVVVFSEMDKSGMDEMPASRRSTPPGSPPL